MCTHVCSTAKRDRNSPYVYRGSGLGNSDAKTDIIWCFRMRFVYMLIFLAIDNARGFLSRKVLLGVSFWAFLPYTYGTFGMSRRSVR